MTLKDDLIAMDACQKIIDWVGNRDLATAWAECPDATWMLWYAETKKIDKKLFAECALTCAKTVLQSASQRHIIQDEDNSRLIIEVEQRCLENPTEENIKTLIFASDAARFACYKNRPTNHRILSAYGGRGLLNEDFENVGSAYETILFASYAVWFACRVIRFDSDASRCANDAAWSASRADDTINVPDIIRGIITIDVLEEKP